MEIFSTKSELQAYLQQTRDEHKTIALIPTMGALHAGHLSLIDFAKPLADIRVCSVFVNPTQFNDPDDLEKYPRPVEKDIELLESAGCEVLFLPPVDELYPDKDEHWHIDLGNLDKVWEGEKRPGHFQGVTQVVYKLFNLVQPDIACFGQKDFQQVMVIRHMVELFQLPVKIETCPIIRDKDGLALSSRNARLSEPGRKTALALSKSLQYVSDNRAKLRPQELKKQATALLNSTPGVSVEYFAICESDTLAEALTFEPQKEYVALVAAWVEGVRLIDNRILV